MLQNKAKGVSSAVIFTSTCDRGTPKCLRCVSAGVECTAINRQTAAEIPRSPVQYLEQRLDELQRIKSNHQKDGVAIASDGDEDDASHSHILEAVSVSITDRFTSNLFRSRAVLQHQAKLFYPSERPPLKIPVHGIYHDIYPRTAGLEYAPRFASFNASKIPLDVARRLFDNYKVNILPRFPCFPEDDLSKRFNLFYDPLDFGKETSDETAFIVTLVLAISSLTSKRQDFRRVAALSESLHADAIRHKSFIQHSSLMTLRCLLLLIQLALLLPHTSNLWYLSGEAVRMAISLGLHEEPGNATDQDPTHLEQRRALFWLTYQLERTVAIAAGCPIALSDDHITTQLPFNGGDPHGDLEQFIQRVSHLNQEKQFLIHVRVCIIQSEIHGVQFFDQDIPESAADYDTWVQNTKDSIQDLVNQITADGFATSWLISAAQQCQVLLHRPCSRNISVSTSSLNAAASASIQLINTSLEGAMAGGLIGTFEIANSAFQAGVVILYALRNRTSELQQASLRIQAQEALDNLVQLLFTLSERWPATFDTAEYIKELIETSLSAESQRSAYDLNVLKELDCLVTQRRIHSIYHRNISVSSKPAQVTNNETSPGFLEDEAWWKDFINEDFDMGDYFDPSEIADGNNSAQTLPLISASDPVTTPETAKDSNEDRLDLTQLIEILPACSHCRDRRVKCHRQLPACKECQRANRHCAIFDPVLLKNVPLSHVSSLAEKVKELELQLGLLSHTQSQGQKSTLRNYPRRAVILNKQQTGRCMGWPEQHDEGKSSHHFFGPWSSLGCLREHLINYPSWELPLMLGASQTGENENTPGFEFKRFPVSVELSLVLLYTRSANTFFPILDEYCLQRIYASYRGEGTELNFDGNQDIIYLVVAIACQVRKKKEVSFACWATLYFDQALSNLDTTCDHSSRPRNIQLLQRTLLICVYLILSPSSGDVWRHLGFGIRLFFDLSHLPSEDEDKDHDLFCMLTRTLYTLESQVSIAFGRPSLLIIGDSLRKELMARTKSSIEEIISIHFYLISFLKMKTHNCLLKKKCIWGG
uniref:Zn(2)-C6 fungal-type domain-containing protein n=1 Tax=Bionectria ochroleuca TaxID=29856 RepID=A0A8H7K7I6_BIOOC